MACSCCSPCPTPTPPGGHVEETLQSTLLSHVFCGGFNSDSPQTAEWLSNFLADFCTQSYHKDLGWFELEAWELLLTWVCNMAAYLGEGVLCLRVSLNLK